MIVPMNQHSLRARIPATVRGGVLGLTLWPAAILAAAAPTYQNPVVAGNLADPAVIRQDGVYYLYATGEVDGDNGTRVYTSTNLVDWQPGPVVFRPGQPHVWAPDVWRDPGSGRFYLYYTVSQAVGVAEADGPVGPFVIRRKLFDRAIDAHLFRDDDGRLYLYFVQLPGFRITVQPLAGPTEPNGMPIPVLRPEAEWEQRSGQVTEGPWLLKRHGRYYLLYSGSGADTPNYAVGYATADKPTGPFTRAAHNPIIHRSEGLFGPGHGCAIQDEAGRWWHIYHQKRTERVEWDRFICVDPFWFDQEGRLYSRASRATPHVAPITVAPPGPKRSYDPFIWKSDPPPDCPFEPSTELTGIEFLGVHSDYHFADTWYPSWAADGNLYSPWTDGPCQADSSNSDGYQFVKDGVLGTFNAQLRKATTGQAVMIGEDPLKLTVKSLGTVQADPYPYGGRYPCGSLVHRGVWYYGTYCLSPHGNTRFGKSAYNWPWLGPLVGFRVSTDYGKTWQETPHTPAKPLFGETGMWGHPVKVGAPHFVDFGKDMEHSPDGMAYLVAMGAELSDPKPRFANLSWITGDQVYLLRLKPSPATINDPKAYEFYAGQDSQGQPTWRRELEAARPLLEWNDNMGCVTATYVAPLKKYLMCITDGGNTCSRMNTYLLEADSLTGRWRLVTYLKHFGEQAYFVNVPAKFIGADGRTLWLCYSGNFATDWNNERIQVNPPGTRYGLVLQQARLLGPAAR
jgi:GH43 family beta-xylosidase